MDMDMDTKDQYGYKQEIYMPYIRKINVYGIHIEMAYNPYGLVVRLLVENTRGGETKSIGGIIK